MAQVERFENYCLEKRRLEGDIESVLVRMDESAVEAVEHAQRELENTKRECAETEARIERARRGVFHDGAEKFGESGRQSPLYAMKEDKAPQESDSNTRLANDASNEPIQPQADIEPSSATSPPILIPMPTSIADSDDFSIVSNPQQEAAGPSYDKESISNPVGHSNDNSSDDILQILVQRYTDICYECRTVQEEIENKLERKERIAVERVTSARIALDTTRQKAVETVAALNEASGGDAMVNLPAGVLGSIDSKAIISPADGAYSSGPGPIVSPSTVGYAHVSDPAKVHGHVTPIPPLKEGPLPTSTIFSPEPEAIRPIMPVEHLSQSILKRVPASELPAATPLSTTTPLPKPQVTTIQQAIFRKYDKLMIAAKAAGSGVSMEKVPWPLFTISCEKYPHKNIAASHLKGSSVTDFVEGYIRWKGWKRKAGGKLMLGDWEHLHLQVPKKKSGGKACMQRVVSILSVLVRS